MHKQQIEKQGKAEKQRRETEMKIEIAKKNADEVLRKQRADFE